MKPLALILIALAVIGHEMTVREYKRQLMDSTAMLRETSVELANTTTNLNRALDAGELANNQTTQALAVCKKCQELLDGVIAPKSTPYQFTNIWQGSFTNDFSDTRYFKGDTQIFQQGYYDDETVWVASYELATDNCPTNFYVFSKFAPIVAYTNGAWQITFAQ